MATSNLFQYYQSIGQPLPSLSQRQSVAAQAGIPNYAGTADQNAMLLQFLVKQGTATSPQNSIIRPGVTTDLSQIPVGVPTTPLTNDFNLPPTVPTPQFVNAQPVSFEDGLLNKQDTLKKEISDLEVSMSNRQGDRNALLESSGIFEDTRKLNELKAEQRRLEDRGIEIPLEKKAELRRVGGATQTEFRQMTGADIESNLLSTLAATRKTNALSETIQTNLAIADSYLKAESDRQDLIYTQKQNQLANVQQIYGNIMTEKQKLAIEERKFTNEITKDSITAERAVRQKQIDLAIENGATPAELNRLLSGTIDDAYTFNASRGEGSKNSTAVQQASIDVVGMIDDILTNKVGLESSVGSTRLSRTRGGNVPIPIFGALAGALSTSLEGVTGISPLGDRISTFRGTSSKLVSDAVLQKLVDIKAQGATLGALSDAELAMLERAATDLRPIKKDGEYTGQFQVSEVRFKEILDTMQVATMKTYIASRLGKSAYAQANYLTASQGDVKKAYQKLLETQPNQSSSTNFSQEDINPTLDLIRNEEGFRSSAYQDQTGRWTIGFGNTTIGGRPVQQGDTISRDQGERLLRDQVVSQYSTGVNAIGGNLNPNKQAALVSFEYNLGPGVWQTSTGQRILSLVASGNYFQAGQLMLQYNKSRNPQTGRLETNPGLVSRRAREAAFLSG